ncbi:MAG: phosphoglycerate dehydrogenase [Gammaproteobacteria bacterium]|nr:phosphoglycerate dehydrogenase [Gammaproteobacteria bacterium]
MSKLLFSTSSFNLDNFKERSIVEAAGFEFIFNPNGRRLTEEEILELLDEQVVGMLAGTEPLTRSVIRKAKSLKVISRCGTGLDNVDLDEAHRQGVRVYNTPDAPTSAVAELTLAHILSLSRYLVKSDKLIHAGNWQSLMGRLIARQTMGVVGFGRVGRQVARLLEAFGAKVLVYDKVKIDLFGKVEFVEFEQLLKESDVVTLHLPYASDAHHLINEKALRIMKTDALLVNVARGGLIDENALYQALKEKRLGGAALDCFESEPYTGPLLDCDNVQMTAHMGSYAKETRAIMEENACSHLVHGLREQGLLTF